jgi:hypothetical protein
MYRFRRAERRLAQAGGCAIARDQPEIICREPTTGSPANINRIVR